MSCSRDAHLTFFNGMQQVELKQTSLPNLRHVALLSAKRALLLCWKPERLPAWLLHVSGI